jgi:hypothetical protein
VNHVPPKDIQQQLKEHIAVSGERAVLHAKCEASVRKHFKLKAEGDEAGAAKALASARNWTRKLMKLDGEL